MGPFLRYWPQPCPNLKVITSSKVDRRMTFTCVYCELEVRELIVGANVRSSRSLNSTFMSDLHYSLNIAAVENY